MTNGYRTNWDLDVLFAERSNSADFLDWLTNLEQKTAQLGGQVANIAPGRKEETIEAILNLQTLLRDLSQAGGFVDCLTADDMGDARAGWLEERVQTIGAGITGVTSHFDALLAALSREERESILADERMIPIRFAIEERVRLASEKLDPARESLIADLQVDGFEAWERLYYTLLNRMTVVYQENGTNVELSMGQAANKLGHPDRNVRKSVFPAWARAWETHSELFAQTLNHIAGSRLTTYKHRGWDDFLMEPLQKNRMKRETLDAVWAAVEQSKTALVPYLERKAKLMGVEKPEWFDFGAAMPQEGSTITFDEAADFVVKHFGAFSPDMGEFAKSAISNGWVESENRPGKRTGAFCTRLPVSGQTRVFMTFSGTIDNVFTLAHELGHAYHGKLLADVPFLATRYPMGLAESASTFAETLVVNAAIREATSSIDKIAYLGQKLQNAVSFFMDIHARFLFETRFYARRKESPLSANELCDLMVEAQKEAFCDSLASYHPYFWASKLHFYMAGMPFYNFPYTIGFLFSNGLYARYLAEGPEFAGKYRNLLADTGRMTLEEVAHKHLGEDLTKQDFWQSAVDVALADITEFLRLTQTP